MKEINVVAMVSSQDIDPDWFFYLSKELSHVLTTYLKELRLLKSTLSEGLPNPLVSQTEYLTNQINGLMRDRELWEDERHGLEVINLLHKYFNANEGLYVDYVNRLEQVLENLNEEHKLHVSLDQLVGRVVCWISYIQRVCGEAGCCENQGKVNFSPMLDKRVKKDARDTSLDPSILCKLHLVHLITNRILAPYEKAKLRLLTVVKLQELVREMDFGNGKTGIRELLNLTGEFLRQGILLKLNKRKGLQSRIFFLFRNTLIYGTRVSSTQGFRLHGVIYTNKMELLTTPITIPNSFSILVKSDSPEIGAAANEKILILAAFNTHDQGEWIDAISHAINTTSSDNFVAIASLLYNSSEELLGSQQMAKGSDSALSGGCGGNRANALSHVCYHRNLSLNASEILDKESYVLSGPLLRKFKNSPGWQKLWVTFGQCCLFFYKSANEVAPLASLPLLGYKIGLLSDDEREQINKDNVFKLEYKTHVYMFRSESKYTFTRWVSVLRHAMIDSELSS